MLIVLISGAPGCGKGTQSTLIVEKYNINHLSTGELLRKEVANKTEIGQLVDSYISKGQLVPDDLIIKILSNHLDTLSADKTNGIILDGFPRTLAQAEALEEMMSQRECKTDILLDISVPEEELVKRLLKRGEISGRTDDNLDTIKERLEVYHTKTEPINTYYKDLGKYTKIDGMGTVEQTFERIITEIDQLVG